MPALQPELEPQTLAYEGFEIHICAAPIEENAVRYTYTGYVCHPGANPAQPGHTVPYHADGEETFRTQQEAVEEAAHIGRSIIDGTHPDLSVLSLVTHGY
ncbi:hypothetical protein G3N59_12825 [Paraburkholderia sp. Ac-20340]|uniref:hypothetical protein n=1 Tax=Paraburkholderia sp. Ac-20340 TaxID=2703888 RepID=UPI00198099CF|nr:hypothetical protein [Paraburkholderia sp. Ac-20340]MBN3854268.1 hypothetical protein [Paraburkholderia sp. Ac-20340]